MSNRKVNVQAGDKFDHLTVLKELEPDRNERGAIKQRIFEMQCSCGTVVIRRLCTFYYERKGGNNRSCGCKKSDTLAKAWLNRADYHGLSKSPEHKAWVKIKERCFNPNSKSYCEYGGAGIIMCDEWKDNFLAFYEHIGEKPKDDLEYSVDRIDNNRGYEPGNVRWATMAQQARNKNGLQSNNTSGVKGVHWEDKVWPDGKNSTLYAVAQWRDINGKHHKKSFSVKKYGKELAELLATEYREYHILLLNLGGAGYSAQHLCKEQS